MTIDPITNTNNEYLTSPVFQALDPSVKEFLIQSFTSAELNSRFLPELFPPEGDSTSILDFFGTLQDSAKGLRRQLFLARDQDLKNTVRSEALAAAIAGITDVLNESGKTGTQVGADVKTRLTQAEDQVTQQNTATATINSGNQEEINRASQQVAAYNTFKTALTKPVSQGGMGATFIGLDANGDELYSLPNSTGQPAKYNAAASTYISQTNSYNSYWTTRSSDLASYTSDTLTYNTNAATNTSFFQGILDQYNLHADMASEGYTSSFTQPTAGFRTDLGNLFTSTRTTTPASLSNPTYPVTINAGKPTTYVTNKATASVSSLQVAPVSYPTLSNADLNRIASIIGSSVTAVTFTASSADQLLTAAYRRNLSAAGVYDQGDVDVDVDSTTLPRKRIYPNSAVGSFQPSDTSLTRGSTGLTTLVLTRSDHMLSLMGQSIINLIVRNFNFDEATKTSLANQVLLLAFNLIEANSTDALLPSLTPLAHLLSTLSPNDPVLTLLFALSLVNQLQNSVEQGDITEALRALVAANPELANLTDDQINSLAAALNAGVLLVAAELLVANLGTPELLPAVLSTALSDLSDDQLSALIHDIIVQRRNELGDLRIEIEDNFVLQGFSRTDAAFLAEQEIIARTYALSPPPTSISSQSVDHTILVQSIQAGLVKSGLSVDAAETIANEALQRTLQEGDSLSYEDFTKSLERNLSRLNIDRQDANNIAEHVVIVTPQSSDLDTPEGLASFYGASPERLSTFATSAVYKILGPNIGGALSALITAELNNALFGTPNPSSADKEGVKLPNSLINAIKNQLSKLKIEDREKYTEAVSNLFKETIKPSVELNVYLQKLMDPAYYFLYVLSQSSLMTAKRDVPTVQV